MSNRVLVAMSGGVDSSVAAVLLKAQGYEVIGAHMKLWDYADVGGDVHRDGRCCSTEAVNDCRMVCDALAVPFYVMDFSEQFRKAVIENFVSEYRAGRTPNPCIRCNSEIRWAGFMHKAREVGCDHIATGHYASAVRTSNRWGIRRGADSTRDQSYFLWGLSQEALLRTLMPLGDLHKTEVREIARRHGLRTRDKQESREVCFIPDDDYRRFLAEWDAGEGHRQEPGEIVHEDGSVLGTHRGTAYFTIGQRRGLGVAYARPLYVKSIDVAANRVIVARDESLYTRECRLTELNWVAMAPPQKTSANEFETRVKIRYRHQPAPAVVRPLTATMARVSFRRKQRAITPGQSAVFYHGDLVLGGGVIA